MNDIVKNHNIVFVTFDTLRYDVAFECMESGQTPNLHKLLSGSWELRHAPGNFTYAAHHAFFAGYLPTPVRPGIYKRLFALNFAGSRSIGKNTCVFEAENIVAGLHNIGFHTICIGGVGFFNKQNSLGTVLPNMFCESHWDVSMGVTNPKSTENQLTLAANIVNKLNQKYFLYINISALHQPNYFYLEGTQQDCLESHKAALIYIDSCLPILVSSVIKSGPTFCIFTSDHGTAYGEKGYWGASIVA